MWKLQVLGFLEIMYKQESQIPLEDKKPLGSVQAGAHPERLTEELKTGHQINEQSTNAGRNNTFYNINQSLDRYKNTTNVTESYEN